MNRITVPSDVEFRTYALKDNVKSGGSTLQDFIDYIGRLETKLEKIEYQINKTNNHLNNMRNIIGEEF